MILRMSCSALLAALAMPVQAQTFSPREQQMLMQPSPIAGEGATLQRPAEAPKRQAKGEAAKGQSAKKTAPSSQTPSSVSFSSELNSATSSRNAAAPALKSAHEAPTQQKSPFDQRVPFGPLSLGLQAEAGPRSDSLVTPLPNGMNQFKKERTDPYVGVSIIDIKR
jgi:hypothetical protein